VPPNEVRERRLGAAFRVLAQEVLVGEVVHSSDNTRAKENRTKKTWGRGGARRHSMTRV
jgi:hypothetical protein